MSRSTLLLIAVAFVLLLIITSIGEQPPVTHDSPCEQVTLPTGTTANLCPYINHTGTPA